MKKDKDRCEQQIRAYMSILCGFIIMFIAALMYLIEYNFLIICK